MESVYDNNEIINRSRESLSSRRFENNLTIFLFLLPSFLLFAIFVIYPIFQSVYYSLFNWKGFGPAVDFVALDNYRRILSDRVFMLALRNGVLIVFLSLAIQLPFSLGLAILVGRDLPGRRLRGRRPALLGPEPDRRLPDRQDLPGRQRHRGPVDL